MWKRRGDEVLGLGFLPIFHIMKCNLSVYFFLTRCVK